MTKRWPDWDDEGKLVSVETDGGKTITGTLVLEDVGLDGEDEYPIWKVEDESGVLHSLLDDCEFFG